jgi:hypothetical protein
VTGIGPVDPRRPAQPAERSGESKPVERASFGVPTSASGRTTAPGASPIDPGDTNAARMRRTLGAGLDARLDKPALLHCLLESEMHREFGRAASPGMLAALERAFQTDPGLREAFDRLLARTARDR